MRSAEIQWHLAAANRALDLAGRSAAPAMESCTKLALAHLELARFLITYGDRIDDEERPMQRRSPSDRVDL